jgi:hypothetical protein
MRQKSTARALWRGLRVGLCALGIAVASSAPAVAQPADNPCTLAVSFFCQFVPMAPDLDGDVDLTTNQTSSALLPDTAPPADPCVSGCI